MRWTSGNNADNKNTAALTLALAGENGLVNLHTEKTQCVNIIYKQMRRYRAGIPCPIPSVIIQSLFSCYLRQRSVIIQSLFSCYLRQRSVVIQPLLIRCSVIKIDVLAKNASVRSADVIIIFHAVRPDTFSLLSFHFSIMRNSTWFLNEEHYGK